MGILHRLFARRVTDIWQSEQRWLYRLGWVRAPEAVQWISTSTCDLKCPHCYSHAGRKTRGELTTEQAKQHLIDQLVIMGRPTLVIAGGETLLRHDFAEIVQYAHRRRVPWALHSHGGWIDREEDLLRRCPPVMAAISLDGPPVYHDRFRGKPGSFDAAMRAMAILKQAGCPEVVAGTTVTSENADLIFDMVPIVLKAPIDSWGLHLMTPEGRGSQNPHLLPSAVQLSRVAALARRLRSLLHVELDNEWGSAGQDDCFYRDEPFLCGAGRTTCVVSVTGEVMPCTTTDPSESQGNVLDRPLSEIWAEGFRAFRTTDDPTRSDGLDCWLQTRHGRTCRRAAFESQTFLPVNQAAMEPTLIQIQPGVHP